MTALRYKMFLVKLKTLETSRCAFAPTFATLAIRLENCRIPVESIREIEPDTEEARAVFHLEGV